MACSHRFRRPAAKGFRAACSATSAAAWSVAALVLVLGGCSNSHVTLDADHSANLLRLSPEWPGTKPEKILTPAQIEVYEELGRPDAMRLLFNRRGDIYRRDDAFHEFYIRGDDYETIDRAWIYRSRDLEVRFAGGTVDRRPLTDKLNTLLDYGDPNEAKRLNETREKWFYYNVGRIFTFDDDKLVQEENIPRTGFRRL
jgi:hypothetical protein